ncbi:uncharacterized protein LOC111002939 isoform X1 [Pieris rapae]|uniref:uncharacterized protein LOC111002939 isoform X1 n=1 Tax=Pieris rapae TaxID=64459 RepID=UPI001E27AC34|nr:uncharacterized protein LOC111002939 isoform X1 [Pieris rapae]
MLQHVLFLSVFLLSGKNAVDSAKQDVRVSDSYLPVAMQIIAHLTDQMSFEMKDEVPIKTTTTHKPLYVNFDYFSNLNGWFTRYRLRDITTPFHKPGLYSPSSPPKPSDRISPNKNFPKTQQFVLLPIEQHQYSLIKPQGTKPDGPLLAAHNEEVNPIVDPAPNDPHLLPPYDDLKVSSRSDDFDEENLQYLSANVREMIRMANDPDDDRIVDVWEGLRVNPAEPSSKGKLSTSNLRLLLLYDLLSRDAKRQRLSDFSGFSPEVMKSLVESSSGGARAQLSMALSKMVERHDCGHDYANNRSKEMVAELAKDESTLSTALRYLQPLVYKL